jgi:hypothetical protein
MALTEVAVQGMTLVFSDPNVQGTITITGSPSAKVKASNKGVYKDNLGISVTNITYPSAGATTPDPGPKTANFSATIAKVKADGQLVLVKNDETGTINATPYIPGAPPTPYPISFKVKISNAGQTKSKAQ